MAVAKRCYRLGDQPLPRRVVSCRRPGREMAGRAFPGSEVEARRESSLTMSTEHMLHSHNTIDSCQTSDKIVTYCSSTSHVHTLCWITLHATLCSSVLVPRVFFVIRTVTFVYKTLFLQYCIFKQQCYLFLDHSNVDLILHNLNVFSSTRTCNKSVNFQFGQLKTKNVRRQLQLC